jgi:hypothetical protein
MATRPIFQAKTKPRTEPDIRVEMLCIILTEFLIPRLPGKLEMTHVPSVTPASPLTFCGSSLKFDVRLPVLFWSSSKNSTGTWMSHLLVNTFLAGLTILPQNGPKAERPYSGCQC